jgi:hypothetical protein
MADLRSARGGALRTKGAKSLATNEWRMSNVNVVTAVFDSVRCATAAVDWFRNQGIDPSAIGIMAQSTGENPRPTRPGDNGRSDLSLIVTVDLDRVPLSKQLVVETMKREGGKISRARRAVM